MHDQRILCFCFLFVQTALSIPPISESYGRVQRLGHSRSPQDSRSVYSQFEHHGNPQPMAVARSSKRDDDEEDDLRVRHIDILTTTIPLVEATHGLEVFYNFILYNALETWINTPPQLALSISLGCLQVRMSVIWNDGPPRGIPWAFVRNFARNMLAMTRCGFAGTYDMYYSSIPGARRPVRSVQVSLRVCRTSITCHHQPQRPSGSLPSAIDPSRH